MVSRLSFAIALAICAIASTAQAHIHLLEPPGWIEEDALGGPQKMGPCGEGPSDPGTPTDVVTTFQAGETITVEWEETVYHSGHFRISLARERSELADPAITVDSSCNYQPGAVNGDSPEYPVLLDNLYPRTPAFGASETFSQEVTLPADMTCEKCTLQVIQFMTNHTRPCIYYHCADIRIVAAGGAAGTAGTAGASGASGGAGSAGQGSGGAGAGGSAGMGAGTGTSGQSAPMTTSGSGGAGGLAGGGAGMAAGMMAVAGGTPGAPVPTAGSFAMMPTSSSSSSSCSASSNGSAAAGDAGFAALALAVLFVRRRQPRA